jgi:hypothetical protein
MCLLLLLATSGLCVFDLFTFITDIGRFSLSAIEYRLGESSIDVRIGVTFVRADDTVTFDGELVVAGVRFVLKLK